MSDHVCSPEDIRMKACCLVYLNNKELIPRDLTREERRDCIAAAKWGCEKDELDRVNATVTRLYEELEVAKLLPMPKYERECLCCGKKLESSIGLLFDEPEEILNFPPYPGTIFETSGNYGSTVFDSFGHSKLSIVICDECMKAHADRVVRFSSYLKHDQCGFKKWDPKEPDF
jgi:hypothetical protein